MKRLKKKHRKKISETKWKADMSLLYDILWQSNLVNFKSPAENVKLLVKISNWKYHEF